MKPEEVLIKLIEEASKLSYELSEDGKDKFAKCAADLLAARRPLLDRSAECQCDCHTGGSMHFKPCQCYSGRPVKPRTDNESR